MSGHGDFNYKLKGFKLTDSDLCSCGAVETSMHVLVECPIYNNDRIPFMDICRRGVSWPPKVEKIPINMVAWQAFKEVCRKILLHKRELQFQQEG